MITLKQIETKNALWRGLIPVISLLTIAGRSEATEFPYQLVPLNQVAINPLCHSPQWILQEDESLFRGRARSVRFDRPGHDPEMIGGYHFAVDLSATGYGGNYETSFTSTNSMRTFIKFVDPDPNAIPNPVNVTYIGAFSSLAQTEVPPRTDETTSSSSFVTSQELDPWYPQLVQLGTSISNATYFTRDESHPGAGVRFNSLGDEIASMKPIGDPFTITSNFGNINGTWVSNNDFALGAFGFGAEINIPFVQGWARGAWVVASQARAFKPTYINGHQVSNGWDPADVDADNEIGSGDFERVVYWWGATDRPFEDIDNDGEVGPGDFESIVDAFGTEIFFDLRLAGQVDDTTSIYNWAPNP